MIIFNPEKSFVEEISLSVNLAFIMKRIQNERPTDLGQRGPGILRIFAMSASSENAESGNLFRRTPLIIV